MHYPSFIAVLHTNDPDDIRWLLETHLRNRTIPDEFVHFQSFTLYGHSESSPTYVELYNLASPELNSPSLLINLENPQ